MAQEDRDKWNKRYAEDSYRKGNPVTLLENWIEHISPGKAIDIACGTGRNAIFMAQAGFNVDAIDISSEGLKQAHNKAQELGLDINWIEHDLEQPYNFDTDYRLIVVMWYVNLALISRLRECMAPGAYLICEEHMLSDCDVAGPCNPDFRVAPGQLREVVSGLEVLLYEESIKANDDGEQIASARVVARRPG
jgi:SAM-dependent methyltransferase